MNDDKGMTDLRMRAESKLLRVTFPDGTVVCYKTATKTFIEALRKIGVRNLASVNLELCHLPLFSTEVYPRLRDYMKPLDDGWYVNVQSDTAQKYLQLVSVKNQLGLDIVVELGEDFEPSSAKGSIKPRQKSDGLQVRFPDGTMICGQSPKETYLETFRKIGPDSLRYREITLLWKEIITRFQKYSNQTEIGKGVWITIPGSTKDKVYVLEKLSDKLHLGLEISTV